MTNSPQIGITVIYPDVLLYNTMDISKIYHIILQKSL